MTFGGSVVHKTMMGLSHINPQQHMAEKNVIWGQNSHYSQKQTNTHRHAGKCASHPLLQVRLLTGRVFAVGHVFGNGRRFLQRRLSVQGGVAHVLVDGVDGHLRDVFRRFGLDVQRDQTVCYQVVDGLEAFLPDEMLPIVKETEVSGLIPKAEEKQRERLCWTQVL